MSDDLRTRIAAVIYADVIPTPPESVVEQAADAVIRELQLHRESDNHHGDGTTLRHRYVTEWTTNE